MKLKDLISYGYLVTELPYCFTAEKFSRQAVSAAGTANSFRSIAAFSGIKYSVPGKSRRRVLSIPHPIPYLILSKTISDNWVEIEQHFHKSDWSFSQTTETGLSNSKQWKQDFEKFKEHCILVSSTRLWELKVDIQSFYSSIYTHSISWALHGKEIIKSALPNVDTALLGYQLDSLVQLCQKRETKGIPTGSENFRIIAEIISTAVDAEFKAKMAAMNIDIVGARYLDDGHYFFLFKPEVESAKRELELILEKYHLELQPEKTAIIERPCGFEERWLLPITGFKFTDPSTDDKQRKEIMAYANLLITLALENPKKSVIKYGFGKFGELVITPANKDLFEALLYRVILCSPAAIKSLIWLLNAREKSGHAFDGERLKEFTIALLQRGIEFKYEFETNWALYIANLYQIRLDGVALQDIIDGDDVLAIVQLLDMQSQGLIKRPKLNLKRLASRLNVECLMTPLWIVAYEAELKNWLPLDILDSNAVFKKLKRQNVTFYRSPRAIIPTSPSKNIVPTSFGY